MDVTGRKHPEAPERKCRVFARRAIKDYWSHVHQGCERVESPNADGDRDAQDGDRTIARSHARWALDRIVLLGYPPLLVAYPWDRTVGGVAGRGCDMLWTSAEGPRRVQCVATTTRLTSPSVPPEEAAQCRVNDHTDLRVW